MNGKLRLLYEEYVVNIPFLQIVINQFLKSVRCQHTPIGGGSPDVRLQDAGEFKVIGEHTVRLPHSS